MLDIHLIKRVERGKYVITEDGHNLLNLISKFYQKTKIKRVLERKKLVNRYSYGWKNMMEKKIAIDPKYQPCWISYLGAVSGVMKALGREEHDLVNTGGYTGYAFALPNVLKGTTCPSGPTALGQMWNEIINGTNFLGYKTRIYADYKCFPTQEGELNSDDRKRANKLFQVVKEAIDNNEPIVLWGLPIPEYGIVSGYQEKNYIVSTYRRLMNQPDLPVAFNALQAPGGLHAIIFEDKASEIPAEADKMTLQRAITLAKGDLTENNYIAGAKAYKEWAEVLEKAPQKDIIYHGNAYVNECTLEAKEIAAAFLRRLAAKYEQSSYCNHLLRATEEYDKIIELLKSFQRLFPFAFEGDLSEEKRYKGAKLLQEAVPYEMKALEMMQQALNAWE